MSSKGPDLLIIIDYSALTFLKLNSKFKTGSPSVWQDDKTGFER